MPGPIRRLLRRQLEGVLMTSLGPRLLAAAFKLEFLAGYRTYLAAAGALGLAVYEISRGNYEAGFAAAVAFIGLIGLKPPPAGGPPTPEPPPNPVPSAFERAASGVCRPVAVVLALGLLSMPAVVRAAEPPVPDRGPVHVAPVTRLDDRGPIWTVPPQPVGSRRVVPDPGKTPWHVTQVGADQCWAKGAEGDGTVVAVLDTGADLDHPLLRERVVDAVDYTNSPIGPGDRNQHGTHTATTVAQVAPKAKIIVVKVLGDNGSGYDDDIGKGIDYSVQKARQIGLKLVVSMSLGSSQRGPYSGPAVRRALDAGAVVVASAGNSGEGGVGYPGAEPGVLCIAAVDGRGQVAGFSSRGSRVDVAAGGVDVAAGMPGGGYQTMSGTSMSCPVVSGCAALVLGTGGAAWDGSGTARDRFRESAKDLPPAGHDRFTGYGLVQPLKMVDGVQPAPTPDPNPVPPPQPTPPPGPINLVITEADLTASGLAKLKAAGMTSIRIDLGLQRSAAGVSPLPSQSAPFIVMPAPVWQPQPLFGCPGGVCPIR